VQAADASITHQIVDRPTQGHRWGCDYVAVVVCS
jgi:hypothetical protein